MGENSAIAWTDHTFNPWWGCAKVSDGCANCYADVFAKRVGHGARLPTIWGVNAERKTAGEATWREPLKWDRAAAAAGQRARVFCASMADVFEDRAELVAPRARLATLVVNTPHLDWLLLTKRPENADRLWRLAHGLSARGLEGLSAWGPNVWLGTSVENQAAAERRIPHLLAVPAAVRFLSCEPLLGPVDLDMPRCGTCGRPSDCVGDDEATPFCSEHEEECGFNAWLDPCADERQAGINWVIVGGESGPRARPFALDWARGIVEQCARAEVACFVKQMGADPFDGTAGCSVILRDPKGGDPAEWPKKLRVRQFPEVRHG
mgnify:CR=1 FL=1